MGKCWRTSGWTEIEKNGEMEWVKDKICSRLGRRENRCATNVAGVLVRMVVLVIRAGANGLAVTKTVSFR